MLFSTVNLDIDDKLVNGTLATIKKLDRDGKDHFGDRTGREGDDESAGSK
jgi:hypothetical protein